MYSVSKKSPPWDFMTFFSKRLGIFRPNFTHILDVSVYSRLHMFYQIVWNFDEVMPYLAQPPSSNHKLRMSTIGRNAHWHFLTFSPNSWEFLVQILLTYYTFLSTLDNQFFIQLSLTETKLCHIKCDHPACVSTDRGHFEHITVVAHNMA